MKFSYSLIFIVSFIASFFMLALACFVLKDMQNIEFQKSAIKSQSQLEHSIYLKLAQKTLDSLIQEKNKSLDKVVLDSDSPFFALILKDSHNKKQIHISQSFFPLHLEKPKKRIKIKASLNPKQQVKLLLYKNKQLVLQKTRILIKIFNKIQKEPNPFQGFVLKNYKFKNQKHQLTVLIKFTDGELSWLAFLKRNKNIFQIPKLDFLTKTQDVFIINSQSQILFHNQRSKIFKKLSQTSRIHDFVIKFLDQKIISSDYTYTSKSQNTYTRYQLNKWGVAGMILISKSTFKLPFWYFYNNNFYKILYLSLIILFLIMMFVQFFRLGFAYNFLKFAFLNFDQNQHLPPPKSFSGSLLYFYNNRYMFFNQKLSQQTNIPKKIQNLSFQQVIHQEIQNIQSAHPHLKTNTQFTDDVMLFHFEKNIRTITQALIKNAIESMGGLKDLQMDFSLTKNKKEDMIIFCIRDYGVGLNKKQYKKVFELYYSTKSQVGVGLNLVQSLVQANGGQIFLQPAKRLGLRVCVHLPLKSFLKN